jgi:hypothetical protein
VPRSGAEDASSDFWHRYAAFLVSAFSALQAQQSTSKSRVSGSVSGLKKQLQTSYLFN